MPLLASHFGFQKEPLTRKSLLHFSSKFFPTHRDVESRPFPFPGHVESELVPPRHSVDGIIVVPSNLVSWRIWLDSAENFVMGYIPRRWASSARVRRLLRSWAPSLKIPSLKMLPWVIWKPEVQQVRIEVTGLELLGWIFEDPTSTTSLFGSAVAFLFHYVRGILYSASSSCQFSPVISCQFSPVIWSLGTIWASTYLAVRTATS